MRKSSIKRLRVRVMAGLLALALAAGAAPAGPLRARAAESWVQGYLDKLVDWGVMRGDQDGNLEADRDITRAEYISMINRAYGYDEVGVTPFNDVSPTAWYADDVGIAYKAGYFSGTSDNSAEPEAALSREQATVILGRNLMLEQGVGEVLDFTDSRELSDWSRGLVKTAAANGVVHGYPDGTFKPHNRITRGEVASLLVNSIGTPVSSPGEYTLGNVYGNVTVSSSGVTLRDTVIAGDLYLSGGVGLGYVTLENVTVLGKIVASGAGESNKGESSIILRNVTAPKMVVDSPANQYVTVRTEGNTDIASTSVRTPAYLEDTTESDRGFRYIELAGEEGTTLELAGNIKEVVSLAPNSVLTIARGSAQKVTVDEKALGARVVVDMGAEIKVLNLDVGTQVTGSGDVETLNVNAAGCTVSMLPDNITIRPGLTASIGGQNMDTVAATESSLEPRLLSGYPQAQDVAPSSLSALFSTNKQGTVYWAVSSISDGSVGEDDLISPPSYGSQVLKSGSVKVTSSSKEFVSKISGLTSDGSYYLAAIMVDARGQRSPVKVISLATPDDSVPNFASGYPVMSQIGNIDAWVSVMTTKDCKLYSALMPKGSAAPKPDDFKAGSLTGNLGFRVQDMEKNTPDTFQVNNTVLKELETYDLYLWLSDADGAKSSAVKKVTFTTVDKTPPEFTTNLSVTTVKETAVGFSAVLNEQGTLYWAVVKADADYLKPLPGQEATVVDPASDIAKLQVFNGTGALKSGKVAMNAAKDAPFNVSGLEKETAYDLYYVAQDKAGNFSSTVQKLTFNTLDVNAPTAALEFTSYNGNDTTTPLADTDVRIVFNERVQTYPGRVLLEELYDEVTAATGSDKEAAKDQLSEALESIITFYELTGGDQKLAKVGAADRTAADTDWTIDYRNAKITSEDGKTVITFENAAKAGNTLGAINLRSGSTYRFDLTGLSDTTGNKINALALPGKAGFTTAFAQVNLKPVSAPILADMGTPTDLATHMAFTMEPISTSKVDDSISWDMIIWSDTTLKYDIYQRITAKEGGAVLEDWKLLGGNGMMLNDTDTYLANSLTAHVKQRGQTRLKFEKLNDLTEGNIYEYAIQVTTLGDNTDEKSWNSTVNMKIGVVAGSDIYLEEMASRVDPAAWEEMTKADGHSLTSVGNYVAQGTDELPLRKPFNDQQAPKFDGGRPAFTPGDSSAEMEVMLDRAGTVYYAVAKKGDVLTMPTSIRWQDLPGEGTGAFYADGKKPAELGPDDVRPDLLDAQGQLIYQQLTQPTQNQIISKELSGQNESIKTGSVRADRAAKKIKVTGLEPETEYMVYFVLQGSNSTIYSDVLAFGFKTEPVVRPVIELTLNNPSVTIKVDRQSDVDYLLIPAETNWLDGTTLGTKILNETDPAAPTSSYLEGIEPSDFKTRYPLVKTFYDALTTDFPDGTKSGGSVFDRYFTQAAKDDVATFIRSQAAGNDSIFMQESVSITAGGRQTVDCSKAPLAVGQRYMFLAVAKSPLGSGDAFRAIYPIFLRSATPPKVASFGGSLRLANGSTTRYVGDLTVTFTTALYKLETSAGGMQSQIPVVAKNTVADPTKQFALGSNILYSSGAGIEMLESNSNNAVTTVQFKITSMFINQQITFDSTELCDVNGTKQPSALTITLKADGDGNPYFAVTPKAWDGTEG